MRRRGSVSPSGNGIRLVATLGLVVEDFSGCASELAWLDSVEADVELLAIICEEGKSSVVESPQKANSMVTWVWEVRVSDDLAGLVVLGLVLGALESVLQLLLGLDASLAVGSLGPDARASVFVKVESTSALVLDVLTVDAGVENLAYGGIGMGEESVLARAEIVLALWWLCRWQNQLVSE